MQDLQLVYNSFNVIGITSTTKKEFNALQSHADMFHKVVN